MHLQCKSQEAITYTCCASHRKLSHTPAVQVTGSFSRTLANPQGNLWKRKGWAEMDKMRAKLEDLKELRDLVRSLGRGGGWGPLRRAPIQYLDMKVVIQEFKALGF